MRVLFTISFFTIFCLLFSCKHESTDLHVAKKLKKRVTNIDAEYIGGTIVEFDKDGNMICTEISRESMSFNKTKSGLLYKFIKKNNLQKPLIGDILVLDMKYFINQDSLLFNSKDAGEKYRMRLEAPTHRGSIEEGFLMMGKGDSAVFKVDAASFYKYTRKFVNIPSFVKLNDKIVFQVKLLDIIPQTEFSKTMSLVDRQYAVEELSMINRFLINENLQATPTKSGLYLINLESTNGKYPKNGNKVDIYYNAMFIDGGLFDAVDTSQKPFSFTLGNNEVIQGLEEAVSNMREGERALAIIPFRLAYGSEKYLEIPPYSTLLFEISLAKVYAK